jgi:hypothetical protein
LESSAIRALSGIRSLQNAHSPINRLYPDALLRVFEAIPIDEDENWMVVNSVCRYWRNTALYFPSLWSFVVSSWPTSTITLCLERSKSTPLYIDLKQDYTDAFLEALSPHMSRISEFDIVIYNDETTEYDWPPLSKLLGGTAPMLRNLSIEFEDNRDTIEFADCSPLLLKLDAPVLQSFTLRGISLRQLTGPIVNLTELILENDDGAVSPMTDFLDLLESNTNLRLISLVSAGPRRSDGDPYRVVHLNSLEVLTMYKASTQVVLNHLSLPATTDIDITEDYDTSGLLGNVGQVLPTSLTHLPSTKGLKLISIKIFDPTNFAMIAHRSGNAGSITIGGRLPSHYSNSFYSFYPLSVMLVRELRLHGLDLDPIDNGVTDEYLQSMFFSLPSLDTLVLKHCKLGAIFQMLQPRDGHVPCPSLTSLTIYVTSSIDCLGISHLAATRESAGASFKKISLLCSLVRTLEGVEFLPKCVDVVEISDRTK